MKIEFSKLHAENTFGYKELDLTFDHGFCIITGVNEDSGGSNGSGKSTCAKLFFYSLTGTTPEGLKTDSILSDFHPINSAVLIEFKIKEDTYLIKRYREHSKYENKLVLLKNELDISRKNVVDTQKAIYDILGLDREHLLMLTLFSVDTISFAKSTPAERRNLFTELFPNINRYKEDYASTFKLERDNLKKEISDLQDKLNTSSIKEQMEQKYINDFVRTLENIIMKKTEIEESKENSAESKNEEEAIKRVNEKTNYIKTKFPEKLVNNSTKIAEVISKMNKQQTGKRQERNLLEVENRGRDKDITRIESRYSRFKEEQAELVGAINKGECSNCGTVFRTAPPKYKQKLDEVTAKIATCEAELEPLRKAYSEVLELINKFKEEEEDIGKKLNILYNFQVEMEGLAKLKEALTKASEPIIGIENQLAELDRKESEIRAEIGKHTEQREKHTESKDKFVIKLSNTERLSSMYEFLAKISSVDIPTYLLNKNIVSLEAKATEIMGSLFPGYRIVLSDTATTKKGSERAELTLGIETVTGTVKDYRTLSGGERQAVDISLLLGLQGLVSDEKGITSNVIFLDEILDISADQVRTESIIELLKKISRNYDTLFLISHKSILTEDASTLITVTKRNGISSLTEIRKYD